MPDPIKNEQLESDNFQQYTRRAKRERGRVREILIAFLAAARWHLLVYVYYVTSNILDPSEKTNKDGL